MSNMSYCRFENTYRDLSDCYDHITDDNLSDTEKKYRKWLIEMCQNIIDDVGEDELQED